MDPRGSAVAVSRTKTLLREHPLIAFGDFPTLERKAVRVIQYFGAGRIETIREHIDNKGYAVGF